MFFFFFRCCVVFADRSDNVLFWIFRFTGHTKRLADCYKMAVNREYSIKWTFLLPDIWQNRETWEHWLTDQRYSFHREWLANSKSPCRRRCVYASMWLASRISLVSVEQYANTPSAPRWCATSDPAYVPCFGRWPPSHLRTSLGLRCRRSWQERDETAAEPKRRTSFFFNDLKQQGHRLRLEEKCYQEQ